MKRNDTTMQGSDEWKNRDENSKKTEIILTVVLFVLCVGGLVYLSVHLLHLLAQTGFSPRNIFKNWQ